MHTQANLRLRWTGSVRKELNYGTVTITFFIGYYGVAKETTIDDKIVETLYSNRATSEA